MSRHLFGKQYKDMKIQIKNLTEAPYRKYKKNYKIQDIITV